MPTTDNLAPTKFKRRSQLYRRHIEANAVFEEISGSAVVATYADESNELYRAARLGLADLSTLPRIGFKGADTASWLALLITDLPSHPNLAVTLHDGNIVARLSSTEFLILGNLSTSQTLPTLLQSDWSFNSTSRVYQLPRCDSHSWFALSGSDAASTLAKLCGVDMRPKSFSNGSIAQTSLAHINAIVLRHDLASTPCYYLFTDTSCAEYFWDVLLDSMSEFDGRPVGIRALRTLDGDVAR